jgi:hypothetical protein
MPGDDGMLPAAWLVSRLPEHKGKEPRELQEFFQAVRPNIAYILTSRSEPGITEIVASVKAAAESARKSLGLKSPNKLQHAYLKQLDEL